MNRKLYFLVLIISSLLVLAACSNHSGKPVALNEFLFAQGVALTCGMDELAESKEYLTLLTSSESIGMILDKIASQDYSIPKNAYLIKLPDDIMLRAMSAFSGDINISDNIMEKLKYKINASMLANMINASYGSEMIAATAMTTWGKSYIQPNGWSNNRMLLLEYDSEFSSIVSFVQSGDGVISGSSVFVKKGDKDILTSLGEYLGMADIEYDQYSSSQIQGLLTK
jgi:hypothetical protein